MADNVELDAGSGGAVIATDDDGTAHYQYVKVVFGADNTQTKVTSAVGLPVGDAGGSLTVDNAGTFAVQTGAERAEDAAHSTGHTGLFVLSVRADAAASTAGTDGDYAGLTTDATGRLWCNVSNTVTVASHAVTNAGTFVVQIDGAALTALQLLDNAVYVDDADWTDDTSSHLLVGGVYQATPHTVTDGDVTPFLTDANGRLAVSVGNTVTVASHAVTNAGTFAVQVTSIVPGTAATNLGKAEDAVHTSGDVGVMALVVRQDSQSDLGADGDYVPLTVDGDGGLRVTIVAGAGSGGTAAADDADFSAGTTQGTPAMGVYESAPSSVTDGDLGTVGITQTRALRTAVEGTVTVASHAVTNAGTFAVQSGSERAEDAAHSTGHVGNFVLAVRSDTAAATGQTDGDYTALVTDSTGRLWCNVSNTLTVASHAVTNAGTFAVQAACTNAGTFAVQVDGAALTALQLIDNASVVDDAAFTPATTGVTMAGFFADETAPDSVNEGDGGAARMTLDRMVRVVGEDVSGTIRAGITQRSVSRAAVAAATSGDNTLVTNSNGGLVVRVFALALVATSAVSLYFTSDGGGTVIFGGSTNKIALAANGGFVLPYNPAGWFDTAADHNVVMNLSGAVSVSGGIVYAEV